MPSRAEVRGRIETVLRAVSVAIIAYMLWQSLDHGRVESVASARTAGLSASLRSFSRQGIAPDQISVQLDSSPAPRERDWLAALGSSGSKVSWTGSLPAVGIGVQPIAAPTGGYNVLVSAPAGFSVVVGDEIGTIDTLQVSTAGGTVTVHSATGVITAKAGGTTAQSVLPDSLKIRRVLVLGDAGWESKFVIAALEEDGWKVDALARVAPGVSVTQGGLTPIDTSRYSAVVALDNSASAFASDIVRYVSSGGGVVIGAQASSVAALSPLRAGNGGRTDVAAAVETEPGSVTLQSLPIVPLTSLKGDAIPLEKRGNNVTIAARRFAGGRVLQMGYLDTWRWRMSGGDNSVADHRSWWTHAVSSVAYAPPSTNTAKRALDDAPVARLIASLGPPTERSSGRGESRGTLIPFWLLFAVLSASLLGEWLSRRLRGMR